MTDSQGLAEPVSDVAAGDPLLEAKLEFGNAGSLDTGGTGWFIGYGSHHGAGNSPLRHVTRSQRANGLSVKWCDHEAGRPGGDGKPVSTGRTISMLVGGQGAFRLDFSLTGSFEPCRTLTRILREPGDYAIWGEGVYHRWRCEKPCSILTIRWQPEQQLPG